MKTVRVTVCMCMYFMLYCRYINMYTLLTIIIFMPPLEDSTSTTDYDLYRGTARGGEAARGRDGGSTQEQYGGGY